MQVESKSFSTQNTSPEIQRVLRWFNQNNELVNEVYLENANLAELQKLFAVSVQNPMYDCYLVETQLQKDYLEKHLKIQMDTDTYDYFLECDAVN